MGVGGWGGVSSFFMFLLGVEGNSTEFWGGSGGGGEGGCAVDISVMHNLILRGESLANTVFVKYVCVCSHLRYFHSSS